MTKAYRETDYAPIEQREIVPLPDLDAYNALSEKEIAVRQAAVTNYFVTFAINYSRRVKKNTDYLLEEVAEFKEVGNYSFDGDANKAKEIRLARKLVEADEVCGTVLDRLISFCITPGTIENVRDKKLLNILNRWESSVGNLSGSDKDSRVLTVKPHGLGVVFEQILERLFVDGDSIIGEVWDSAVDLDGKTYQLPYKINIHDTLLVEIDQDKFSSTGQEEIYLNLESVNSRSLLKKLNKEAKIPMFSTDPNAMPFCTHLKLRPKTFNRWGVSYFKRAFNPVASKKRIEALEVNTIEGLINRLTILKAGKLDSETESGIIAPHRLAILEQLISQPKVNNLILWPGDDIEVEDIGPSSDILSYDKKYAEANEQLLASLGFPRVLIDGGQSSTENWQKFLGLISFIEHIRKDYLIPWVNNTMRKIAIANGFKNEYPRYSFTRVKLYKLVDMLNAVKVFYDRGLMSELSAITSGGLDYDIEKSRREYEAEFGILSNTGGPKDLPFSKNAQDGSVKDGNTSPEKSIDVVDKAAASIKNPRDGESRRELVKVMGEYLQALHKKYTDEIVKAAKNRDFDKVFAILFVYETQMKKDIKAQMRDLFRVEIDGVDTEDIMYAKSVDWIEGFCTDLFIDMNNELESLIEGNKQDRPSLLPDLIAGIMGAFSSKRIRLYSSAIYNKAKAAGDITRMRAEGYKGMRWKSALTERTCEWCGAMHNKVMDFDTFFENFPSHPSCECWGEALDEVKSIELPEKDPNNWSKVK